MVLDVRIELYYKSPLCLLTTMHSTQGILSSES